MSEPMTNKQRLLDLIEAVRGDMNNFFNGLSEEERSRTGEKDNWSAKDFYAHLSWWQTHAYNRFMYAMRNEQPPDDDDERTELNQRVFEEHRDRPWDEIRSTADDTLDKFAMIVQSFEEDELSDPNFYPWRNGQPLWMLPLGVLGWHAYLHMSDYFLQQGDQARADHFQERLDQAMKPFEHNDRVRGISLYDSACYHAKTGNTEKALEILPEALRLRPDLVEFSKQDSDLEGLREDPRYRQIYKSLKK